MNKIKNIIYLCTAEKGASGGAKIIYQHSEVVNNLNKGIRSEILHIKKKRSSKIKKSFLKRIKKDLDLKIGWQPDEIEAVSNFSYKWFSNKIKIKADLKFDPETDFVILPEIFAHLSNELLIKNNIKYAIFVQNGYAINCTNNLKEINNAYQKASFIISYSKNITNCIKSSFPLLKTKIISVSYSIDSKKFNLNIKKNNTITYMNRKLPIHSHHLRFFLKNNLPKNWSLNVLNNLSEKQFFQNMEKSKIFLSFSELESLPLPPVEAAIAGNVVIGYTGEGGKEYWKKPIFHEVNSGNILKFLETLLKLIKTVDKKKLKFKSQRNKIIKDFSVSLETKNILNLIANIKSL